MAADFGDLRAAEARILRERDPDLLTPACGVVRGINLLCVTRREPSKLRYPPGGKSHRGGGLPLLHAPFFTVGKKFRVPMYLATSFDEEVAYRQALLSAVVLRARLTVRRQVLADGFRQRRAACALDCTS